jgi:PhnB protein
VKYHSVTPRIVVADPAGLVAFLHYVFAAEGELQEGRPSDVHIGDSVLLVTPTSDERDAFPAFLYVYVDDTPYGDRRATVQDDWQNTYQIAHPL